MWGAGAPDPEGVLLANGIGSTPAVDLMRMLTSPRVLLVHRADIEARIETVAAAARPFAEKRWAALDVA